MAAIAISAHWEKSPHHRQVREHTAPVLALLTEKRQELVETEHCRMSG
jgi:hypothetical protein